ncbi:signal transduction histidine kinase [Rubidibacter lacunae KORDI 51-2]|uniref:histidine kinase n=1 Tax=Rubidibacter lacunae KORDI 51-2 TaxID=582515 RepID=U5D7E3_9CHRO|nr:GAF domain-containing sensor histidine kinase [Rubidibacter lacunae]ERN40548.1 signal transduction histidine kinase [Rubidibacter lacunae KORDI 51-2]
MPRSNPTGEPFRLSPADPCDLGSRIDRAIARGSNDAAAVLSQVAQALGETFAVPACCLLARSQPTASVRAAWWFRDGGSACLQPDRFQTHAARLLSVTSSTEPVAYSSSIGVTSEPWSWLSETFTVESWLGLTLPYAEAGWGGIWLGGTRDRAWTVELRQLLLACRERVAVALVWAGLQESVQHQARYQGLRRDLGDILRTALHLNEVLAVALGATGRALEVARAFVLALKYDDPLAACCSSPTVPTAKVEVIARWAASPETPLPPLGTSFALADAPCCQQAWQQAPEPLAIADLAAGPLPLASCATALLCEEGASAWTLVPLAGRPSSEDDLGCVLGFLVFQQDYPRHWHGEELELLQFVASQVSAATLHHKVLQRSQALVEARTAQLQHSLEVQAKLYETTRQQVNQLQHLNQLKDEFLSTMSHELNTPLATMKIAVKMLGQPGLDSERRAKYLDILDRELRRESALIRDLLALQQIASSQTDPARSGRSVRDLDLHALLHDIQTELAETLQTRGLTLSISYLPPLSETTFLQVRADGNALRRVIQELLTNASKFAAADTSVRLQISQRTDTAGGHRLVLTFTNTGVGIHPEDLPHIFAPFRRGRGATKQAISGTGLGLALAESLVKQLDGTLEAASDFRDGMPCDTRFTLALPQSAN